MKKILLVSNKVMHYRSKIYNAFYRMFGEMGYEFHVVSNEFQPVKFDIKYKKHQLPFDKKAYKDFIDELKPDVCINFLHIKDKLIFSLTRHCHSRGIPMIYWNHGINLDTPDSTLKNLVFHYIHHISDAIILYSDLQLKYIWEKDRTKTFIAWNTLDFSSEMSGTVSSPQDVKKKYGIKEDFVVMYISRILPYKSLDTLLDNFNDVENLAVVVVGGGLSPEQKVKIDSTPNYYYLGEKYSPEVDEIYNMGDVFSTPGHIGLAVNQAMFWGKPVFVLNRRHAPEICYLKNGVNGWMCNDSAELKSRIVNLAKNPDILKKLSQGARNTFDKEMRIQRMFQGFKDAVEFVENKKAAK